MSNDTKAAKSKVGARTHLLLRRVGIASRRCGERGRVARLGGVHKLEAQTRAVSKRRCSRELKRGHEHTLQQRWTHLRLSSNVVCALVLVCAFGNVAGVRSCSDFAHRRLAVHNRRVRLCTPAAGACGALCGICEALHALSHAVLTRQGRAAGCSPSLFSLPLLSCAPAFCSAEERAG